MEYWVEENIRPNTPDDMDRVLFEHIKTIVDDLKKRNQTQRGSLITWHFFREHEGWRAREGWRGSRVWHIRFRVRTTKAELQNVRKYLEKKLDLLKENGEINDHYHGGHGKVDEDYQGESEAYDEKNIKNPEGWTTAQKWFECGSEIELIFLKNRFQGVQLGEKFNVPYLLHLFCNQSQNRYHDYTLDGRFMIIRM